MHYVYLIESVHARERHYIGQTNELKRRLQDHNLGKCIYTSAFRPWHLVCYLGFAEQTTAITFERYLKGGSGKAFLRRHFL